MKGDRFRIPVDDEYALALGRAVYVFSVLEWNAVWFCQAVKPGYVTKAPKSANQIANDLIKYAPKFPSTIRVTAIAAATKFKRLVVLRNGIIHGRPSTVPGGAQHLNRYGSVVTIKAIDAAADDFAACSIALREFVRP